MDYPPNHVSLHRPIVPGDPSPLPPGEPPQPSPRPDPDRDPIPSDDPPPIRAVLNADVSTVVDVRFGEEKQS
jgi:hypothetical protein